MLARLLSCCGDKCTMTTKAMPGAGGRFSNNCSKAGMQPAEAPMPTTRNLGWPVELDGSAGTSEEESESGGFMA